VTVDDDAPRLSSTEVRKLITLMELPFVVPFEDRVKVSVRLKFGYTLLRRVTQFNVFQQTHFTVLVAFFLVNLIIKLPAYS